MASRVGNVTLLHYGEIVGDEVNNVTIAAPHHPIGRARYLGGLDMPRIGGYGGRRFRAHALSCTSFT